MKYTKEERLDIGRRIYDGEFSRYTAAEAYNISDQTARDYMRMYRAANHLPPKHNPRNSNRKVATSLPPVRMEDYETMTKEELIRELVKSKISEARLKKGYGVKGVGADKEYIHFDNKSTK
jgi:transposase